MANLDLDTIHLVSDVADSKDTQPEVDVVTVNKLLRIVDYIDTIIIAESSIDAIDISKDASIPAKHQIYLNKKLVNRLRDIGVVIKNIIEEGGIE